MQPADPFRNNPLLSVGTNGTERSRRTPWVVSVVVHVLFMVGLLVLPGRFAREEAEMTPIDIVFYKPEVDRPAPPPLEVAEPEPLPEPVETAQVLPEPTPLREPEVARHEPPPPPAVKPLPQPERIARALPKPEPEPPTVQPRSKPRAKPKTGTFGESKPEPRPARTLERVMAKIGSFANEPVDTHAPEPRKSRVVAAGSFGGGAVEVPRDPAPARRDEVVRTGFGVTEAAPKTPRKTKRSVVATAAFTDQPAAEDTLPTRSARAVSEGGFGAVENKAAGSRKRSLPEGDPDTPVEIVSKPKPAYTDAARNLRIEGEVVLEVTFVNSGELRVLRVVNGLGHGLDEAAIEAAKKIQFTPARRDGRPVDHTATLRVVFRLA